MKVRAYAPALVAIALVVAVYIFMKRDRDEPAPPAPVASQRVAPSAAPPAPALEASPQGPTTPGPTKEPHVLTPEEYAGHEPKAKKPKMTLDDKLVETQKHIEVMQHRAELLEKEIAELERKGDKQRAAEQRIVLERLRKHAEKLREDVAARREPQ